MSGSVCLFAAMFCAQAHAQSPGNPEQPTYCAESNGGNQQNPVFIGTLPGVTVDANGTYRASSLVIPGECVVDASGTNVVVTGLTHVEGTLLFEQGSLKNTHSFETGSLQVDAGAYVTANGILTTNSGQGPGTVAGYNNGAGGSYGGAGGSINSDGSTNTSYEYDTIAQPTYFGSAGFTQASSTCPGPGGGPSTWSWTVRLC